MSGQRFLGGFIGDADTQKYFTQQKVSAWSKSVEKLAEVATTQPQAAFAALTKSLQFEWAFFQRVTNTNTEDFAPLEAAIRECFLPTMLGFEVSATDRILYSLPTRTGGLGIRNPTETGPKAFETSLSATKLISEAIIHKDSYNCLDHEQEMRRVCREMKTKQTEADACTLNQILTSYDNLQQRSIRRISSESTSAWLTVIPDAKDNFDLSPQEFRNALCLRYRRPLLRSPLLCDGCGQEFTIGHALKCKRGGLVILRHNEIRDAVGDLANLVWPTVHREPVVREADDQRQIPALVADLGVRGVWQPQDLALLDIRVIDTDATSYQTRAVKSVLRDAETSKKRKYATACTDRRAAFTPFIVSVDGAIGPEATTFIRRLSERLSLKWSRPYSRVTHWVRTRLSFAIVRATSTCLRGSRVKWRSIGFEDGAALQPLHAT